MGVSSVALLAAWMAVMLVCVSDEIVVAWRGPETAVMMGASEAVVRAVMTAP